MGIEPVASQQEFGIGDRIPIVLYLQNATEAAIEFQIDRRLSLYGPQLIDAADQGHGSQWCRIKVAPSSLRFTLQPDDRLKIPLPGFGLGENPKPGEQLWHPFCTTPPVGPVCLVQRFWLDVFDHANGIKKHTRLDSGEIEVRLHR